MSWVRRVSAVLELGSSSCQWKCHNRLRLHASVGAASAIEPTSHGPRPGLATAAGGVQPPSLARTRRDASTLRNVVIRAPQRAGACNWTSRWPELDYLASGMLATARSCSIVLSLFSICTKRITLAGGSTFSNCFAYFLVRVSSSSCSESSPSRSSSPRRRSLTRSSTRTGPAVRRRGRIVSCARPGTCRRSG